MYETSLRFGENITSAYTKNKNNRNNGTHECMKLH